MLGPVTKECPTGATAARCTLGDSIYHRECVLSARNNYNEDTWDAREGGEMPPLPRNCMRVCRCSAVL